MRYLICFLLIVSLFGCGSKTMINSVPEGATVTIQGHYRGETPLLIRLPWADAKIDVKCQKAGYSPQTKWVIRHPDGPWQNEIYFVLQRE